MDMITKLMQPQVVKNATDDKGKSSKSSRLRLSLERTPRHLSSDTLKTDTTAVLSTSYGYGFNSRHTHGLSKHRHGISTSHKIGHVECTSVQGVSWHKTEATSSEENEHFDADYACDFVDMESNDLPLRTLKMKSPGLVSKITDKDDTEALRRLARHSKPLISSSGVMTCLFLFVWYSLAHRWCLSDRENLNFITHSLTYHHSHHTLRTHDRRITDNDPNVESGWNIWNISASLLARSFWLSRDALCCLDRSLISPYVLSIVLTCANSNIYHQQVRSSLETLCLLCTWCSDHSTTRSSYDTRHAASYSAYLHVRRSALSYESNVSWWLRRVDSVRCVTYSFITLASPWSFEQIRRRDLTIESRRRGFCLEIFKAWHQIRVGKIGTVRVGCCSWVSRGWKGHGETSSEEHFLGGGGIIIIRGRDNISDETNHRNHAATTKHHTNKHNHHTPPAPAHSKYSNRLITNVHP